MSPDVTRLRDMAARYTAAWCSQDPARVAAFFAPDGSLRINDAAPAVGRGAIAAAAQGFMAALPDMQVQMDGLAVEEGRLVYRWTLVGTSTGPGGTGRSVRVAGFEAWRLDDDDLIVESLGHLPSAEYERQLRGQRA